jgi:hypothetical protein
VGAGSCLVDEVSTAGETAFLVCPAVGFRLHVFGLMSVVQA